MLPPEKFNFTMDIIYKQALPKMKNNKNYKIILRLTKTDRKNERREMLEWTV